MNKEILLVVDAVSNEKGVAKSIIFEAIEAALAMATSCPADVIGRPLGRLLEGRQADFLCLDNALDVTGVWVSGHMLGD